MQVERCNDRNVGTDAVADTSENSAVKVVVIGSHPCTVEC
jgi:hypothetical protein